MEACVFDVQRFSLHDGPGIRTLVFLKGCPLSCAWCCNPESRYPAAEIGYYPQFCIACGACERACACGAVSLREGRRHFERSMCRECDQMPCVAACPANALRRYGVQTSVDELVEIVRKDELFYRNSGGGVTVSGGEPLLQSAFVAAFLTECKTAGLDTAIETSGYADWDSFERLLGVTDLFLFDLKHAEGAAHIAWTGVDNDGIVNNLRKLAASAKRIVVRIPVVPGFNDDRETIGGIVDLARGAGVREVHLLPYHRLGSSKYDALGIAYPAENITLPANGQIEELRAFVEQHGMSVRVGG